MVLSGNVLTFIFKRHPKKRKYLTLSGKKVFKLTLNMLRKQRKRINSSTHILLFFSRQLAKKKNLYTFVICLRK